MKELLTKPLIPYETQRDNWNLDQTPNRNNQCMIEGFTHLTRFGGLLVNDRSFSHISAYNYLNNIEKVDLREPGEDRFHGSLHIRYLNFVFKGRLEFERTKMTLKEIKEYLRKYQAPIIGGFWIGHILKGAKSHIAPIVGSYESQKEKGLILQDPYGDPKTGYTNHNGELVKLSDEFLSKMITDEKKYVSYFHKIKEEYLIK